MNHLKTFSQIFENSEINNFSDVYFEAENAAEDLNDLFLEISDKYNLKRVYDMKKIRDEYYQRGIKYESCYEIYSYFKDIQLSIFFTEDDASLYNGGSKSNEFKNDIDEIIERFKSHSGIYKSGSTYWDHKSGFKSLEFGVRFFRQRDN